jgi:N6-L-threonylcarbamoyladenine synthase
MDDYFEFEVIGKTIDDAAGEAFDKSAKLLGLPYPGGPLIDKYAKEGIPVFAFSQPQIPNLDFSFSGLKTNILYFLQKQQKEDQNFIAGNLNNICASIQDAIIKHLMKKLVLASVQTGIKNIALAGGVSANSGLRNAIQSEGEKRNWETFIPPFEFCTDNAAMVGITAHYKFQKSLFELPDTAPIARF